MATGNKMINDACNKIAIAILTGGLSTRMGSPKENIELVINGKKATFLQHLCANFEAFPKRYISENKNQNYDLEGYISIKDEYEEIGPLGGIYSVLKNSNAEAVLFVACDMPLFSYEVAMKLLEKYDGEDALVSMVNGIRQPLASIYTKACIPHIERQINDGNYKLGVLINSVNTKYVDMSEYNDYYINVNTKEVFELISLKR